MNINAWAGICTAKDLQLPLMLLSSHFILLQYYTSLLHYLHKKATEIATQTSLKPLLLR